MGEIEVLKILDGTATELVKKAEKEIDLAKAMDYMMASTMIMNQYLILKLRMTKSTN